MFLSLTTILICLRLFWILTEKLPSFGALFDTIQIALKDLLKFGLGVFVMFIGFVYAAHLIIGISDSDFSTFWMAFLRLFYLIFGNGDRINEEGNEKIKLISDLFYTIFVFCFVFMFLKILMAIVIVRYKYLRSKVQLDNEVSARIMHEKSKKFNERLFNLICCKKRVGTGVLQRMERESNKRTQIAFWQNIVLNYRELKSLNTLQTKEEIHKAHEAMKKKILKEREAKKDNRIKMYSASNFNMHKLNVRRMVVHIIYISLFLVIIMMQLHVESQYHQNKVLDLIMGESFVLDNSFYYSDEEGRMRNLQQGPPPNPPPNNGGDGGGNQTPEKQIILSFSDVTETLLIDDWRYLVLFNELYYETDNSFLYHNYVIGEPMIILNVRRVKYYDNKDPNTKEIMPFYITNKQFDPLEDLGDEADTASIYLLDGEYIPYREEGKHLFSGYVLEYPRDWIKAYEIYYFDEPELTMATWQSISFFWVYVNRNHDFIVGCRVHFIKTPAGEISGSYYSRITMDFYKSALDRFRAFLEICFMLLTFWNLFKFLKKFVILYVTVHKEILDKQDDEMKLNPTFYRLI